MVDEQETQELDVPVVKDNWFWIQDSNGNGSVTVTFATIAFVITTIVYFVSMFEKIGPVAIRPFDSAACASYLTPVLTLYFGRRWTDAKYGK
jgi:hypothetical protein